MSFYGHRTKESRNSVNLSNPLEVLSGTEVTAKQEMSAVSSRSQLGTVLALGFVGFSALYGSCLLVRGSEDLKEWADYGLLLKTKLFQFR